MLVRSIPKPMWPALQRSLNPAPRAAALLGLLAGSLLQTLCAADLLKLPPPAAGPSDFVKDVQPILETNCVSCHHGEKAEGGLDLSNRESAFKSGSEPSIVSSKPDESPLYKRLIVSKDDELLMPPIKQGGPLDKKLIVTLRMWIAEGANWPNDVVLKTRAKKTTGTPNSDDMDLVRRIHAKIVERAKTDAKFVPKFPLLFPPALSVRQTWPSDRSAV